MRRDCPYPKQSKGGNEARGRSTVANVTSGKPSSSHSKKRIDELRRQLREAELIDAVEQAAGTLHGVMPTRDSPKSKLGPTLRAPVSVNGVTANALIDTGSPATIISLEFLMQTRQRENNRANPSRVERYYHEEVFQPQGDSEQLRRYPPGYHGADSGSAFARKQKSGCCGAGPEGSSK